VPEQPLCCRVELYHDVLSINDQHSIVHTLEEGIVGNGYHVKQSMPKEHPGQGQRNERQSDGRHTVNGPIGVQTFQIHQKGTGQRTEQELNNPYTERFGNLIGVNDELINSQSYQQIAIRSMYPEPTGKDDIFRG